MATKDEGRLIYTTDDMSINLYQVRVPLIALSWDPGSVEVETQGGNGRKWEEMGEQEKGNNSECSQGRRKPID